MSHYITRDGKRLDGPFATEDDAFARLLRIQPMSTDWAIKYEGYGIEDDGVLPEHAFVPGDGEDTHVNTCQFPGCGHDISVHEEGEPCCYVSAQTRGAQHAFDCKEY